jgi:hypothetical protein
LTAAAAWKAVTDPKRLVTADVQEKAYKDAFRKRLKRREKEAEPQAKRPRRKGTSRASELADPFSFKGVDRKRPASSPSRQPSKALRARPGRAVTAETATHLQKHSSTSDAQKKTQFSGSPSNPGKRSAVVAAGSSETATQMRLWDKQATSRHSKANDAASSVRQMEEKHWRAAIKFATAEYAQALAEEKRRQSAGGAKPLLADVPQQYHSQAQHDGPTAVSVFVPVLDATKAKFPDCNWETQSHPNGRYKSCPARTMALATVQKHIRGRGAGKSPQRPGRHAKMPVALAKALEATIQVRASRRCGCLHTHKQRCFDCCLTAAVTTDRPPQVQQLNSLTGGMGKAELMEAFKAAIEGSPYARLFDTVSKYETSFRSWRRTEGGGLQSAPVTADAETDVVRLLWVRHSLLVLWRMGEFKECIRLGFMFALPKLYACGGGYTDA